MSRQHESSMHSVALDRFMVFFSLLSWSRNPSGRTYLACFTITPGVIRENSALVPEVGCQGKPRLVKKIAFSPARRTSRTVAADIVRPDDAAASTSRTN